jgi:hypothetical protein
MSFVNHSQYLKVEPAQIEKRSEQRHLVILQRASIRSESHKPEKAPLLDVSSYGCRLEAKQKYRAGLRVHIRFFDRKPVAATVVWVKSGHWGCRFDNPIDQNLLRALTLRGV